MARVWGVQGGGHEVEQAVRAALQTGYRSVDTASLYDNERGVGKAMRESGIAREDIFLTTKVWNDDMRAQRTQAAFAESLERLGTDYVDLYLVHWPVALFIRKRGRRWRRSTRAGARKRSA